MNGSGTSALYASLLRNESPSVIVSERREREDLYLCLFPLVAFLSVWCGGSIITPPLPPPVFLHMPLPLVTASPGAAEVGGWEIERGWRIGKERRKNERAKGGRWRYSAGCHSEPVDASVH